MTQKFTLFSQDVEDFVLELKIDEDATFHQLHESYNSEEDIFLMRNTPLRDFLEEEGQRLAYIYDPDGKRFFLMELTENLFGKPQKEPAVSRRHGEAPLQSLYPEIEVEKKETATDLDEDFYGDNGFDESEIDHEGFEIND